MFHTIPRKIYKLFHLSYIIGILLNERFIAKLPEVKMKKQIRKIVSLSLLLLVVFSAIPFAMADEDVVASADQNALTEEAVVEKEIEIMHTALGNGLRILQLERAITRHILRGKEVINTIKEKTPDADVSQLETLVSDFEVLKSDLKAIPIDQPSKETLQKYLDIRDDVKEDAKEFRKIASTLLTKEDIAVLKEKLKAIDRTELKEINQQIQELRRHYHAERVYTTLANLGVSDSALIDAVKSGQLTVPQIRQALRAKVSAIPPEERRSALLKIKEDNSKRAVFKADNVAERRSNRLARRSNEAQRRSDRLANKSVRAEQKGRDNRADNLIKRSEAAGKRSENKEARSDKAEGRSDRRSGRQG